MTHFWNRFVLLVIFPSSCLQIPPDLLYKIRIEPHEAFLQETTYYFDLEDSTTVFQKKGFRLKLHYMSDQELNREYARSTFRDPNLNPFTYGTDRDLDKGYSPPRFTVFQMTVVNQNNSKAMVDPAKMALHTDRSEVFEYWDVLKHDATNSFEQYYLKRRGKGGNENYYFQERMGLVRQDLYRRHVFVFKGEEYSGKIVFAPLHKDVREVKIKVKDIVLQVDAFDRPKETVDAEFRFQVEQKVVSMDLERSQ